MTTEDESDGKPPKSAIVIAGSHRSGTSALTRSVGLLGWQLPANLMPGGRGNELGHWESLRIVRMNDLFLARLERSWLDPKPLPRQWRETEAGRKALVRAQTLIGEEFAGGGGIVLKDPRVSRLGSLWIEALQASGATPVFVIACRNPLDVWRSLMERNGFGLDHAVDLWLSYVLEAEQASRAVPRVLIHYEDLVAGPHAALERMFAGIGLTPEWTADRERDVDDFISRDHRHFHSDKTAFFDHPAIATQAKTIYERMLGAGALQDHAFFDAARRRWRDRWNQESPGGGPSRYGLERAETFLFQSHVSAEDGNVAEAVAAARRAAALAPDNAQYHAHLGILLARNGNLPGAEAALREAISLDAERAGFHHTLGRVLTRTGRIEEAVAAQRRAIELDANDPRYRAALDPLLRRQPS